MPPNGGTPDEVPSVVLASQLPAEPDPAGVGFVDVAFLVETFDEFDIPTVRSTRLAILAIEADGDIANVVHDDGTVSPGPLVLIRPTPWTHISTLGPGVVKVKLTALYLGRHGESVKCSVEVDGVLVEFLTSEATVIGDPQNNAGSATVTCSFSLYGNQEAP
jgi:hypothetical protein